MLYLLARLLTADHWDRPGDEVSGGGYAPHALTLTPHDDTWAASTGPLTYPRMPAGRLAAVEITDGFRPLWRIPIVGAEIVPAGATVVIPAAAIRVRLAEWAKVTAGQSAHRG